MNRNQCKPHTKRTCGEPFLRAQIEQTGENRTCFYCGSEGDTVSIEWVADQIEAAFEQHFYLTSTDPSPFEYAMMKEGDYEWDRDGDPVAEVIGSSAIGLDGFTRNTLRS